MRSMLPLVVNCPLHAHVWASDSAPKRLVAEEGSPANYLMSGEPERRLGLGLRTGRHSRMLVVEPRRGDRGDEELGPVRVRSRVR